MEYYDAPALFLSDYGYISDSVPDKCNLVSLRSPSATPPHIIPINLSLMMNRIKIPLPPTSRCAQMAMK